MSHQSPAETGTHQSLVDKAKHEIIRFFMLFLYLWIMSLLFQLHQYVVLTAHQIQFQNWGFGFLNALVLAKVMVVADSFRLFPSLRERPLFVPILLRSAAFAILFIAVDVLEKVIVGMLRGATAEGSLPVYGAGGFGGAVVVGLITGFALVPYFAFEELDLALGRGRLRSLLLASRERAQGNTAPS
jgi:hypothetical protein